MPSLKDIRSRINSVKNTQQITRAMKMVSAAKLRRAQENIVNVRPYANKMLSVIADIKTAQKITHPLLGAIENPKRILMIVITSDRGLCGGFNNSINRFTERFQAENKLKYDKIDYFFIGRRVTDYFKTRGITPIQSVLNLAREISYDMATPIAKKCMDEFAQGGYDEVRVIYNEFKSAIAQNLTVETLLPIDLASSTLDKQDAKAGAPFAVDMIFEPNPEHIIEELLTQHFNVQVYRCLAESVAAEHAARMTAMENATKNAKEMINGLTLTYNKLRQASITKELIEICSGADAVNTN